MKYLALALGVLTAAAFAAPAHAFSGTGLRELCGSTHPTDRTSCELYIRGVIETWRLAELSGGSRLALFCLPKDAQPLEVAGEVVGRMEGYGNLEVERAHVVVLKLLRHRFPC